MAKTKEQRREYKLVGTTHVLPDALEAALNELGRAGWVLVQLNDRVFVFERLIAEEEK